MSSFGRRFRVATFGESHGTGVGVVIEGYPSNEEFPYDWIQHALDMRRPGQSKIVTKRNEPDQLEIISGVQLTGNYINNNVESTNDNSLKASRSVSDRDS